MKAASALAADDAQAVRAAGPDLLSLALIDARNTTLRWLAAFESRGLLEDTTGGARPALALAGEAGRFQDHWIGRHLQRDRGEDADPGVLRLPPADAAIEAWFEGAAAPPPAEALRRYLAQTLEVTLDLLAHAPASDAGLHFYRLALRHEDRLGEALAERAAELQLADRGDDRLPWKPLAARPQREPVWFPPQRLLLGSPRGGCVPENERWAHEVAVPEVEIDAQPVSWQRFVEFADDGGYDRRELWTDAGWAWAEAEGRRAPRHVEQLRGGAVLVQRRGLAQRVALGQPVLHASRHEAEAWCRWAGRRLPTEPEWELAALAGASRGFAWGDVFEWVAGSARPWPGHEAGAGALDPMPAAGSQGVLRGASWMTPARQHHPKARRFAPPAADTPFAGFRSCAL
ncbi:MAG: SUMF1/EgtB/PvdO family nonheme iron enzyme [Rubrivivax sp.]